MDARFEVTDTPREVVSGVSSDVPLLTLAWRALRAEHQRRAAELRDSECQARKTQEALATVAEETHRLRSAAAGQPLLEDITKGLERVLEEVGISVVTGQGEPYTGELMELLENIAQRPEAGVSAPYIAEVVRPAILCRGAVVRMGKAVIAVPASVE